MFRSSKAVRLFVWGVLAAGTAAAATAQQGISLDRSAPPHAGPPIESIPLQGGGSDCNVIDFEGLQDLQVIGTILGTPQVTFGPSWLAIIDLDAGGSGNFANEPSPSTIAFFLTPADPIDFDTGVRSLEVFYSAAAQSVPVTLTAWDGPGGTGNIVDTAQGDTVGTDYDGANCTGDPTGEFCLWDSIILESETANIRSITLSGAVENFFGFDNMKFGCDSHVALGDSYSSGEGAGDYIDATDRNDINECHRSQIAWTGDSPGGDDSLGLPGFGDYIRSSVACSGAVLRDLTNDNHNGWLGEGPQLDDIGDPAMITMTMGGNDALFADIIEICLLLPACQLWDGWGFESLEDTIATLIGALRGPILKSAYDSIKNSAPDAAIFVAGYPRVLPRDGLIDPFDVCPGLLLDAIETAWMADVTDDLNAAIACSAAEAGVHFVPVDDRFDGHEACALGIDWINPIRYPFVESFHPNQRGQKEYAREIKAYIDRKSGGSSLPENPDPVPGACGAAPVGEPPLLPTLDDLEVVGDFAAACGEVEGGYAPDQEVTLLGGGFAPAAALELEIRYESGTFDSLGAATADGTGILDHVTTIPSGAPTSGLAMVLARGEGADTAPRLLISTIELASSLTEDSDGDSIPDNCDNCPEEPNTLQTDTDGDGIGDACDACPLDRYNDLDGDGTCDNADDCVDVDQVDLADETVSVGRTESACVAVTATQYEITPTGDVTFIAGQVIEIGEGFVVRADGRFTAANGTP